MRDCMSCSKRTSDTRHVVHSGMDSEGYMCAECRYDPLHHPRAALAIHTVSLLRAWRAWVPLTGVWRPYALQENSRQHHQGDCPPYQQAGEDAPLCVANPNPNCVLRTRRARISAHPSLRRWCERSKGQYRPLRLPDVPMQRNATAPIRGHGSGAQKRKAALSGVKSTMERTMERGMRSMQRMRENVCDAVNELCYTPRGTREERTQKREQLKALEELRKPFPSGSGVFARTSPPPHTSSGVCNPATIGETFHTHRSPAELEQSMRNRPWCVSFSWC
jgi:hypothetical protein